MRRSLLLPLALVAALPSVARAQFGLVEGLFSNVSSVGMYGIWGGFAPDSKSLTTGDPGEPPRQIGVYGWGFELAFQVGALTRPRTGFAERPRSDTARTLSSVTVTRHGDEADTSYVHTVIVTTVTPRDTTWLIEIGLGYGQVGGFRAQDPTFDLRGTIRELPAFSVYLTHTKSDLYMGLRSGLLELQSMRIYDQSGELSTVDGSTFSLGLMAGRSFGVPGGFENLSFFVEGAYTFRKFASLEYDTPFTVFPERYPRELSFSGWDVGVGFQLDLRK
ncbi:MAG: hypothetical protein ACREON_15600 [Gemmatimonadaceae bacterium]